MNAPASDPSALPADTVGGPVAEAVMELDQPSAVEAARTGSKAAALAVARAAGLRVLPGFVLTTGFHTAYRAAGHRILDPLTEALHRAWAVLSDRGSRSLVVRSSSTVEDVGESSIAGRFRSVLDVRTWEDFLAAVSTVFGSADTAAVDRPGGIKGGPYSGPVIPGGGQFGAVDVRDDGTRVTVTLTGWRWDSRRLFTRTVSFPGESSP